MASLNGRSPDVSGSSMALNPSGAPPNFDDPPSLQNNVFAVGLTLSIMSTAFVALRLTTNFKYARKLTVADHLCTFALVMMICYTGLVASMGGPARHTWEVPMSIVTPSYLKKIAAEDFIVGPALWAPKAAVIALFVELFRTKTWLRWTSYITLVITFLFYWSMIPLSGVYCVPRNGGGWDTHLAESCSKLAVIAPIQGTVGVATNILILLLPIPVMSGLNLSSKKKIGVAVVLLAGTFVVIASAVSLYYRVIAFTGVDLLRNDSNFLICTFTEGFLIIIASCAPSLSLFWHKNIAKSKFYNNRISRNSSTNTLSKGSMGGMFASSKPHIRQSRAAGDMYDTRFYEASDTIYGQLTTEIHAGLWDNCMNSEFITKETSIDQKSETSSIARPESCYQMGRLRS